MEFSESLTRTATTEMSANAQSPDGPNAQERAEAATHPCTYLGHEYGEGSEICIGGEWCYCINGSWHKTGQKC